VLVKVSARESLASSHHAALTLSLPRDAQKPANPLPPQSAPMAALPNA
jgi:hypothetical protein